ncbi:MAG: TetR/AcrR family transcriptional regulator [Planctomycetaceae bacterium]|nr:TetR/AcrR family transcriptional regulator [Planctomycetaceae bacterium]
MSRKSTDTKERILSTATNLFSSHGYTATSIDDILNAVGITKGAFYHYFNGKESLCEAALDEAIAAYHGLADLQEKEETGAKLSVWLGRLIERQTSGEWLYCRLIGRLTIESGGLSAAMQDKLKSFWQWCQSFHELLIRQSSTFKTVPAGIDVSTLARLFIAAHFGAMWLDRCAPSEQDMLKICESLLLLAGGRAGPIA